MADDRKLSLTGRGKLGVGKSIETGQVRQSFSHGRSKPVVVERKKRRILRKDRETESAPPGKESETEVLAEPVGDEHTLTSRERDTRAEALKDAIRQAEEERMKASEERRLREEKESKIKAEDDRKTKGEKQAATEMDAQRKAEEDARHKAEELKSQAEEEASKRELEEAAAQAELEVAGLAAELKRPTKAEDDDQGPRGRKKEAEKKKTPGRPVKRGSDRRRSGKLTVTNALEGGDEVRPRSLAALRRAQAKQRRALRPSAQQPKQAREIVIPESITVQELANRMAERTAEVIKILSRMDVSASREEVLDQDTAELVVGEFGHHIKRVSESDVEIGLFREPDDPKDMVPRPPVVTVMGHVDHGKTSLLDAIRQTDVVSGEAGGITQHIGAYQIEIEGAGKITFIDTPGHEAFTEMRARGAQVTDIVVLVVAADDGVKPQTAEAINHAKAAGVPIIVAINKIDREGADPDRVRNELLQHEVIVEKLSGDILDVEVSATKKTNLNKLMEAILLQAEVMELTANPNCTAEGAVIEARLDKGRGTVAAGLIRRGTMKVGDIVVAGSTWGKVRALMDDHGEQVKTALPSQPVEILGLNDTPLAGDEFAVVESEARAREITTYRQDKDRRVKSDQEPVSLENIFETLAANKAEEFPVVIKADVQGSLEAIVAALEKIGNEEIRCLILHAAVGAISETDISLAQASGAPIIGFNVRANSQARALAEQDSVPINYYTVIYDLVDNIKAAMTGRLKPLFEENVIGLAEVKDVFSAGKGRAAGCIVVDGVIRKAANARLLRDDVVVFEGGLSSLRRFKDDVDEVKAGTECGLTLENYADIKAKDKIEVYELIEKERAL
jgi:translation initiation factor IF-2